MAEPLSVTVTPQRVWAMLGALTLAAFWLTTSGLALSPFLQAMADDFQTPLVAITNLLSVMATAWGVGALFIGALSDRVGRRPILFLAVFFMSWAQFGFSQAPSYPLAVACQVLAGLSGGAFMGTVFAAVSDRVPPARRGRALGWIVTGQSLSLVFGVPLIALLGSAGGWRGAIMIYAGALLLTSLLVRLTLPPDPSRQALTSAAQTRPPLSALARADILLLLGAGVAERVCFAVVAVYIALYLQTHYGVSLAQLAVSLALVAAGNVIGNVLGGQLTDRMRTPIFVYTLSALANAALALPLMLWQPGLGVSLGLGFAYSLANALGRPALLAALSTVPPTLRGAVFGMNITSASLGWIASAAFGGWLVTEVGFGALGVMCALAALAGAALSLAYWRLPAGQRPTAG